MAIELRWYQEQALEAIWRWFERDGGNGLVVVPTGGGKSVIMAEFMRRAIETWGDVRFLSVTHVKELIDQNHKAVKKLWPRCPSGVYSAGLGRRETQRDVIFAGIQSVHNKAAMFGFRDIVLVDEAQLIPSEDDTMYRRFLDALMEANPDLKVVGFTATPYRLDTGELHKGRNPLFEGIIYDTPILPLIEQGYLSPVKTIQTDTTLNTQGVKKRGGDFVAGDLERAVNVDGVNAEVVQEIVNWGYDRQSWLIFCAGVDHANNIRDLLKLYGIPAASIDGTMNKRDRQETIDRYKAGELRALVNCNVLTTGFDHPGVDLIAMLRPTESAGLYVQIVGRGLRIADGKDDCLVLDFAENVARHGPIDKIKVKTPEKGDGEAPTKICDNCGSLNYAGVRVCAECGSEFEFESPEDKLKTKAHQGAILSSQETANWVNVTDVGYYVHEKRGKPTTMRVVYSAGLVRYKEWVCFEHTGFARNMAVQWWNQRAPADQPCPETVAEAITIAETGVLAEPTKIMVRPNGKYHDVVSFQFPNQASKILK